jgi:hypothetical protein
MNNNLKKKKTNNFNFSDAMITVAVNSLTSFASGFVIFMFLVC